MATFQVGSTTVSFGAMIKGYQDQAGPVRTLQCGVHFRSQADWETMRKLICYNLEVVPMPWGPTVEVIVKGGPGPGVLTIPGFTTSVFATAFLSAVQRDTWCGPLSPHALGSATFIIEEA